MIKNTDEVKSYFFKALESNGNRFVRKEINPWDSGTLYVFENRLLITSDQMRELKQYLFQIRSDRETDFCYFDIGNHNKEKVIWEGSESYQLHLTQNKRNKEWDNRQNLMEEKIDKEIRELKLELNLGKISSYFQSKLKRLKEKLTPFPATVILQANSIPKYEGDPDQDRIPFFLNILKEHGVQVLDSRTQPDGVTTIHLDRPVKIPDFLQNFLELKSVEGIQPNDCGNSDLLEFKAVTMNYTMILASDENYYYRKKLGY